MTALERFSNLFFPSRLLKNVDEKKDWNNAQQGKYISFVRATYPFISIAYLFHYFFIDPIETIKNPEYFLFYRITVCGVSALIWVSHYSKIIFKEQWILISNKPNKKILEKALTNNPVRIFPKSFR